MKSNAVKMLALAFAGATMTVLMIGCSSGDGTITVPEQTRESIVALTQTPPELSQATFLAARQCLQSKGYDVPYASAASGNQTASIVGVAGLFASESAATAYGYSSTFRGDPDPISAYETSLPVTDQAKFQTAYSGDPSSEQVSITLTSGAKVSQSAEGCLAEANIAVYGSVATGLKLVNFVNEVYAQVDITEVVAVVKTNLNAYHECMSAAGYEISSLNAADVAVSKFGRYRGAGDPPSADEKTMASKDAGCQAKSGLITDTNKSFFTTAASWITTHEGQIAAQQEALTQAKQKAQKIIDNA